MCVRDCILSMKFKRNCKKCNPCFIVENDGQMRLGRWTQTGRCTPTDGHGLENAGPQIWTGKQMRSGGETDQDQLINMGLHMWFNGWTRVSGETDSRSAKRCGSGDIDWCELADRYALTRTGRKAGTDGPTRSSRQMHTSRQTCTSTYRPGDRNRPTDTRQQTVTHWQTRAGRRGEADRCGAGSRPPLSCLVFLL